MRIYIIGIYSIKTFHGFSGEIQRLVFSFVSKTLYTQEGAQPHWLAKQLGLEGGTISWARGGLTARVGWRARGKG